jgi:hypothetical protein
VGADYPSRSGLTVATCSAPPANFGQEIGPWRRPLQRVVRLPNEFSLIAIDPKKLMSKGGQVHGSTTQSFDHWRSRCASLIMLSKRVRIDDHRQPSLDYLLLLAATSAMPTTIRVIATGIEALVSKNRKIKAAKTSRPIPPTS